LPTTTMRPAGQRGHPGVPEANDRNDPGLLHWRRPCSSSVSRSEACVASQ
jgi:hypothetical protein